MTRAAAQGELDSWLEAYGTHDVWLGQVLCDDHAGSSAVALTYDAPGGEEHLTYADLRERSMRLAGALREGGVREGDRVAVMLGKSPELLITLVAIWRLGAVHVPLFTAFGPDAVSYRLAHSEPRLVVTDAANRPKMRFEGLHPMRVVCVDADDAVGDGDDLDFAAALSAGPALPGVARSGEDPIVLLYTSGTTGQPKGVEVPICALASIRSYMEHGLDLRATDTYWNMADPGWAYGLYYGAIGPLLLGHTTLWRAMPFAAEDVFAALVEHAVTNLAGAPTVYRALRAAGVPDAFRDRHHLRAISSAGEPLNAELLEWSRRRLGVPIHDHYGQSELGMAVYFAHDPRLHHDPVAGSMGSPAPGCGAVVLGDDGTEVGARVEGHLAIDVEASPSYWFRGYLRDAERTAERFAFGPRYYLTGDAARVDDQGLLYFGSRTDDVITSSGYRVGPFEIESALMGHPAVAEVAVVGTPDEARGEAITAFVVTIPTVTPGRALAEELQEFVKSRLAKHLYPRRVQFVETLPRTPSGKVRRNVLRENWAAEADAVRA